MSKISCHLKKFIGYSQTIDDVCENLGEYNPPRKIKVLIVFDGMIVDMQIYKKFKSHSY